MPARFLPCYTPLNDPCIDRRKIQYVTENMDRPPTCCCSCIVSASHLVKNVDSTLCFVVELHSLGQLFAIRSNVNCTMQRTQKQYILVDFSLTDCEGSTVTISQQSGLMKGGCLHCQNCRCFSSCTNYRSNNARIFCFECLSKACGCKEVMLLRSFPCSNMVT